MFPPPDRLFLPLLLEERARSVPNATCVALADVVAGYEGMDARRDIKVLVTI
jgi:hypothetical protein